MDNDNKNAAYDGDECKISAGRGSEDVSKESKEQPLDLMDVLQRLEKRMHLYRGAAYRQIGPKGNPARGQGRVLALLKMQPEMPQRELCYLLDMRQQSLSELLSKLEQKGYILRKNSETDRRAVTVSLTEAGRKAAEDLPDGESGDILSVLSPEEQEQCAAHLQRISDEIDERLRDMGIDPRFRPWAGRDWGRGAHHDGDPTSERFGHDPRNPRNPHRGRHGGMGCRHESRSPGTRKEDFRQQGRAESSPAHEEDDASEGAKAMQAGDQSKASFGGGSHSPGDGDARFYRANPPSAGLGLMILAAGWEEDGLIFFD